MKQLLRLGGHAAELLRRGESSEALRAVRLRFSSDSIHYGLRRDVTVPFAAPPAKIDVVVRPLTPQDDLSFLDPEPGLPEDVARTRRGQRHLVAARLDVCWVAVDAAGRIAYMQWLITPKDNARIREVWGGTFPQLQPDEALLEGAYTSEAFRGQGIMPHAMARIAESARGLGARWVITFVGDDNVASLKGCKKAGFSPYLERRQSWRLFRRQAVFTLLPEGSRYSFET
jgi:RimJ/RimL family protein N-acetyltransferase